MAERRAILLVLADEAVLDAQLDAGTFGRRRCRSTSPSARGARARRRGRRRRRGSALVPNLRPQPPRRGGGRACRRTRTSGARPDASARARLPLRLQYGQLRATRRWYLDTEGSASADPDYGTRSCRAVSERTASARGRRRLVLRLVAEEVRPSSPHTARTGTARGTLLLLPLNVVAQWRAEVRKFWREDAFRILWLVQGRSAPCGWPTCSTSTWW